jgi:hypothetical protein
MLGGSSDVEACFGVSGSFFLEARDELIVRRGQERGIDRLIACALVTMETKDDLGRDTRCPRSREFNKIDAAVAEDCSGPRWQMRYCC